MKRTTTIIISIILTLSAYAGNFSNPVWNASWPDPTVFYDASSEMFYSFATPGKSYRSYLVSKDMVNWHDSGKFLYDEQTHRQMMSIGNMWAPCLTKIGDRYLLYASIVNFSDKENKLWCIVVLSSDRIDGGFKFEKILTSSRDTGIKDSIDPHVIRDGQGKVWLTFGSTGGVYITELTPDGLSIAPGAGNFHIAGIDMVRDTSRERCVEGEYLHYRDGWWYLFGSVGKYAGPSYKIVVGRSRNIEGPYLSKDGKKLSDGRVTVILTTDEKSDEGMYGPGHNGEIFTDASGQDYMFYHCHEGESIDGGSPSPRKLFLQRLFWDKEGWPFFQTGHPLRTDVAPVLPAVEILPEGVQTWSSPSHITTIAELNRTREAIDSHAGECERSSIEVDFRSRRRLYREQLGWKDLHYPRVKQLKDSSFILVFQPAKISANIFVSRSPDGISWSRGRKLFAAHPTVDPTGAADEIRYASADALVLKSGEILAFSPFRLNRGYKKYQECDGIAMKRSTDGGHSWSEEQVIYNGSCWEPYGMEMPDGEIHVYFTDSQSDVVNSSAGVSRLRSKDGGKTWSLQEFVSRKFKCPSMRPSDGGMLPVNAYTDQMPAVCVLGDGTKFMAMETVRFEDHDPKKTKTYMISYAWSDDDWARTLSFDEEGPERKVDEAFVGCAPYLVHFPSGETLMSYNRTSFLMRLGNEKADNFDKVPSFEPFPKCFGFWGSIEQIDDHSALAVCPASVNKQSLIQQLEIGRLYLNHRVNASVMTPELDGEESEWADVQDALFVGSSSQSQCTFRFARDGKYLYALVDGLDNDLEDGSSVVLKFSDGEQTESIVEVYLDAEGQKMTLAKGSGVKGKVTSFPGEGYIAEISVPLSYLPVMDGRLYFNANIVKDEGRWIDGFTNVRTGKPHTWIPIQL